MVEEEKISFLFMVKGEVKVGKSHLAMNGSDSVMCDCTADSNSKAAAIRVFGKEWKERYFKIGSVEDLEKVVEETKKTWVCIDEGKDFRDLYGKKHVQTSSKGRKYIEIGDWNIIYAEIKEFFRKWDGKRNFVITEGLKDRRGRDKETGKEIMTGERVADGLNILPTLADVIIHVGVKEKHVGTPPKMKATRKIEIVRNRFLDIANVDEWVESCESLPKLVDEICEKVDGYEKEMFVV